MFCSVGSFHEGFTSFQDILKGFMLSNKVFLITDHEDNTDAETTYLVANMKCYKVCHLHLWHHLFLIAISCFDLDEDVSSLWSKVPLLGRFYCYFCT